VSCVFASFLSVEDWTSSRLSSLLFFLFATTGKNRGAKEAMPRQISSIDRQCPEQNTVDRLKSKYLDPEKIWLGYATVCNYFHTDGLHLSRAQPCSSVSSLSHTACTFLLDFQSSTTDKKLATTEDLQTMQNSNGKQQCHF